jgi:hypothetical protein
MYSGGENVRFNIYSPRIQGASKEEMSGSGRCFESPGKLMDGGESVIL